MTCRAVRGAITVTDNTKEAITEATKELLETIILKNNIKTKDIVSIHFTVTKDLDATFPARAARDIGWVNVPMLCSYEIDIKDGLKKCIRILLTFNSKKSQKAIKHQYLKKAAKLRPDLVSG